MCAGYGFFGDTIRDSEAKRSLGIARYAYGSKFCYVTNGCIVLFCFPYWCVACTCNSVAFNCEIKFRLCDVSDRVWKAKLHVDVWFLVAKAFIKHRELHLTVKYRPTHSNQTTTGWVVVYSNSWWIINFLTRFIAVLTLLYLRKLWRDDINLGVKIDSGTYV